MTKEKVKKLIDKYQKTLETCIKAGNEYDMDSYAILVSLIDENWEYGYGDYTFRYDSMDDFFKKFEKDAVKYGLDDVEKIAVDFVYYDKDCPEDEERIEFDEIC